MRRILAAGLVLLAAGLGGCITFDLGLVGRGPLEERVVDGYTGPKILMIDVSGLLTLQPTSPSFLSRSDGLVSRVRAELDKAADDDQVRALLLRIDSPGGTVMASEALYGEVMRFKQEHHVPVVVQMMGVAASGGYYLAMSGDRVRAYPSTITGSIGVIMAGVNLSGLMDKLGIADQTITTGPYKDAGSPLRPMRPEERAQLLSVAEDFFQHFLDVVDAGRPALDRKQIEKLADGRVYSARQALAAGLIDEVGDLEGAVADARHAAGIDGEARVVVYHRPGARPDNLFSAEARSEPEAHAALLRDAAPGFLYLWAPGG